MRIHRNWDKELAAGRKRLQNPSYAKVVEDFVKAAKTSGQCPSMFPPESEQEAQRQPAINQEQAELKREQTRMQKLEQNIQQNPLPQNLRVLPQKIPAA